MIEEYVRRLHKHKNRHSDHEQDAHMSSKFYEASGYMHYLIIKHVFHILAEAGYMVSRTSCSLHLVT